MIHRSADAELGVLAGRRVAVIGYGGMGQAFALNLRDSGVPLLVGEQSDTSATAEQARADGFVVTTIGYAAAQSDVIFLTLADETLPESYTRLVSPMLAPGDALVFASAYSVAFGFIEPPPFVDCVLIAPRVFGSGARTAYRDGTGYHSVIAIEQDVTGLGLPLTLALAEALGALRIGALEMTFAQAAELDLFTNQAFLPALYNVVTSAAETLLRAGYPPEAALLDLYLSGATGALLDHAAIAGLPGAVQTYPATAQYGFLSRIERYADPRLRRQLEASLSDIRDGHAAHEWAAEVASGTPRLTTLRQKYAQLPLWVSEQAALDGWRGAPIDHTEQSDYHE